MENSLSLIGCSSWIKSKRNIIGLTLSTLRSKKELFEKKEFVLYTDDKN